MVVIDKKQILKLIIESLQQEETILIQASLSARTAATEPEAKPENKYDTRGLEQSYLADGQAMRAQELKKAIHYLRDLKLKNFDSKSAIEVSALVELLPEDDSSKSKYYFMVPDRGGIKVRFDNHEILTVSPESPMGQVLFGKRQGEVIEFKAGGQTRSYEILSVK